MISTLILIVEDDDNSLTLLDTLLTSQGFKVLSATNGLEAWNLLQKQIPDLIISDILMPEMDGFTLCRKCKETEKLRNIPFVFYTATYTDDSEARYAYEIGVSKFLIKPMEVDLFLKEIIKVLEEHSSSSPDISPIPPKDTSNHDSRHTAILTNKLIKKDKEVKLGRHCVEMSEAQYRQLVEFAPLGIMRTSPKGELQSANQHLAAMLGYISSDDMVERVENVSHVLCRNKEEWDRHLELIQTNDQGGFPECVLKSVEGRDIWVEIHGRAISVENGEVEAYEFFIIDITERKQAEEFRVQSEKMRAIGSLAAGLVHEVSTPCNYIQNNINYVMDTFAVVQNVIRKLKELPGADQHEDVAALLSQLETESLLTEIPEALNESKQGIEHIIRIVRSANQFAHPSNNKMTSANMNEAVRNSVTITTNEWKYSADVKLNLDQNLPPVPCVVDQIHQVIINLIVNAVHAIVPKLKSGEFEKGVITLGTSFDDSWIMLTCSDNGTGIPEKVRDLIFNPFFTTKEIGKGTGQGLTIARTLVVKNHGGELTFETEEGKGTTFTVLLPRPKIEPSEKLITPQ
ncbi:PAS domain S-box-containing protein [Maridesulfovibrio ferrireducens]|uniref:histidine kinase n=1 Tax=Maridesulfovibrio ferrireducens TaxID=246191 RepID=A0A1G9FXN3_9BACT|nr:ATP-binding protein [Maridesulfovibrio ferrireducens]SDK93119.1 PAS domain S-box-containing protein [Maridesulfovibrio ferrireducens]